jgi:aryl-alcohol dehydrogenase-like predicted oxidoreductase
MEVTMEKRRLGRRGPYSSAIGLGCMSIGLADVYTSSAQDEEKAIALIHRALDLGVTLLDTANIYGDSEIKVGKALKGRREGAVLATKFGIVGSSVGRTSGVDGSPENVRRSCELSLQRLGRSAGSDRRYGGRNGGSRASRQGRPYRPIGSRPGYDPPRASRSSDCGSAD